MAIYENELKLFEYTRMEKPISDIDLPKMVTEWFKSEEDSLVMCTKLNCKFHKKHCPCKITMENNITDVNLQLLEDCNEKVCSLAFELKSELLGPIFKSF